MLTTGMLQVNRIKVGDINVQHDKGLEVYCSNIFLLILEIIDQVHLFEMVTHKSNDNQ